MSRLAERSTRGNYMKGGGAITLTPNPVQQLIRPHHANSARLQPFGKRGGGADAGHLRAVRQFVARPGMHRNPAREGCRACRGIARDRIGHCIRPTHPGMLSVQASPQAIARGDKGHLAAAAVGCPVDAAAARVVRRVVAHESAKERVKSFRDPSTRLCGSRRV